MIQRTELRVKFFCNRTSIKQQTTTSINLHESHRKCKHLSHFLWLSKKFNLFFIFVHECCHVQLLIVVCVALLPNHSHHELEQIISNILTLLITVQHHLKYKAMFPTHTVSFFISTYTASSGIKQFPPITYTLLKKIYSLQLTRPSLFHVYPLDILNN